MNFLYFEQFENYNCYSILKKQTAPASNSPENNGNFLKSFTATNR